MGQILLMIILKKEKKLYYYSTLLLFIVFFISCKINEPERFYDKGADKEFNASIKIEGYKPNEIICGIHKIPFSFDSVNFDIKEVSIFIDDKYWYSTSIDSGSVYIYSYNYENGPHKCEWYIVPKNAGIMSASNLPVLAFEYKFTIDNTPPTPVNITSVTWNDEHPVINWTKNNDKNFKSYILYSDNHFLEHSRDTVIITDQNITSYVDTKMPKVIGQEVINYWIQVSNGYDIVPYQATIKSVNYGDKSSFPSQNLKLNKNKNSCYCFQYDNYYEKGTPGYLYEISTINESVIRKSDYQIEMGHIGRWSIDYQNNYILACGSMGGTNGRTVVYDLNTLEVKYYNTKIGYGAHILPATKDKIYLYSQYGADVPKGVFEIWNLLDNKISSFILEDVSRKDIVGTATFDYENYFIAYNDMLIKTRIEDNAIKIENKLQFENEYCYKLYTFNGYIYLTPTTNNGSRLIKIDPNNMEIIEEYSFNETIESLSFANDILAVSFNKYNSWYSLGTIKIFQSTTMKQIKEIYIKSGTSNIYLTNDGKKIYAFGYGEQNTNAWKIDL